MQRGLNIELLVCRKSSRLQDRSVLQRVNYVYRVYRRDRQSIDMCLSPPAWIAAKCWFCNSCGPQWFGSAGAL